MKGTVETRFERRMVLEDIFSVINWMNAGEAERWRLGLIQALTRKSIADLFNPPP
jgi:hypothetical protein